MRVLMCGQVQNWQRMGTSASCSFLSLPERLTPPGPLAAPRRGYGSPGSTQKAPPVRTGHDFWGGPG
eukprot:9383379-Alexandrium_andersonii.AAC.1